NQDHLGLLAHLGNQALMVLLAQPDQKAHRDPTDHLDQTDSRDLQDHQARQERKARRVFARNIVPSMVVSSLKMVLDVKTPPEVLFSSMAYTIVSNLLPPKAIMISLRYAPISTIASHK
uniref:Uncharacterized protein n=1 Tax=Parascaris univalens TaxID=6257 RepID=A0A915CAI2_PARUN